MFIKIPFDTEVEFKSNIAEITKMSLEHDYNINDTAILGNFYVSGEYRAHPVSINTETFRYTLPFTVELRDDIDLSTIELNIEDFTYEIVKDNKLKVNIEYSVKGELKDLELPNKLDDFERVDENELESELAYIDNFLDNENESELEDTSNIDIEKGEDKFEEVKKDVGECQEEVKNSQEIDRNMEENKKTVMDTIKDSDDTFVTYQIHIVSDTENIETICKKYNITKSSIEEYNNNLDNLNIGDKVLIPVIDE